MIGGAVATGGGVGRRRAGKRSLLEREMRVEVDLGRSRALVTEPQGDDGGVRATFQEPHGRCVPERVGTDPLDCQGRAVLGGGGGVPGHEMTNGVATQVCASGAGEHRIVLAASTLGEPGS